MDFLNLFKLKFPCFVGAEERFIDNGDGSFAGYTDWRLPSIKELSFLVDVSLSEPAINTVFFPNTKCFYYWSATTHTDYTDGAWAINFVSGFDNYSVGATSSNDRNKSRSNSVRAVRNIQ